ATGQRDVDDRRAGRHRLVDRLGDEVGGGLLLVVVGGDPDRQDGGGRCHPEHAVAAVRAVAVGGDHPGHAGAVRLRGPRVVVVPVDQVDPGQHVAGQVGVGGVHSRVDHRDRDPVAAGELVGGGDVEVVEVPLGVADLVGLCDPRGHRGGH